MDTEHLQLPQDTDYVTNRLCDIYMSIDAIHTELYDLLVRAHGNDDLQLEIIKLMDRLK